jgi:MoaA/NifB/PqqE/SkfB family radical SAM enzyme
VRLPGEELDRIEPACKAPYLALHLDPKGAVRACCENRMYALGHIPKQSILEIWNGDRLAALRRSVAADDFSMGCHGCEHGIRSGERESVRAGLYDHHGLTSVRPERPVRLELELSNRCNLECVMCNGELSSAIRTRREHRPPLPRVYGDEFFDELATLAPGLDHVSFLGGEPFLGPETLRAFGILQDSGFTGRVHVTTNGTVVNERVAQILETLTVDLSISMDGFSADTLESIRLGASHAALLENIAWFHESAKRRHTELRFHYCLMHQNFHELRPFLAWADGLEVAVTVIPVRNPLEMNLERADRQQLLAVVDTLRHQDATSEQLTLNRRVWEHQLNRLEAVAERRDDELTEVTIGRRSPVTDVTAEIEHWAGESGVLTLSVDPDDLITSFASDPSDLLGADAPNLQGQHIQLLLDALEGRFGPLGRSTLRQSPRGIEDRQLEFESNGRITWVRAIRQPPLGTLPAVWHLGARETPPTGEESE